MDRDREIKIGANLYSIELIKQGFLPNDFYKGFIAGARWADNHPHWNSVDEEGLPATPDDCMFIEQNYPNFLHKGYYDSLLKYFKDERGFSVTSKVTHWCKYPKFICEK